MSIVDFETNYWNLVNSPDTTTSQREALFMFGPRTHYDWFNRSRIDMLDHILGSDWWPNKSVLELACGIGRVGIELKNRGAIVTFTDGRPDRIELIRKLAETDSVHLIDQNRIWSLGKTFDLVLYWGILYHLPNWRTDLNTAIRHGRIISIDTEVLDRDTEAEVSIKEHSNLQDQSMGGMGIRPTTALLESWLRSGNIPYKRWDHPILDKYWIRYTWKSGEVPGTTRRLTNGFRRFYMLEGKKE